MFRRLNPALVVGDDPAFVYHDSPGLQLWLQEQYPTDPAISMRARQLRAENLRRFQAHLARCPRANRTS